MRTNEKVINWLTTSIKIIVSKFINLTFFLLLRNVHQSSLSLVVVNEHKVNENHFDNCYIPFLNLFLYPEKQAMDDLSNIIETKKNYKCHVRYSNNTYV